MHIYNGIRFLVLAVVFGVLFCRNHEKDVQKEVIFGFSAFVFVLFAAIMFFFGPNKP